MALVTSIQEGEKLIRQLKKLDRGTDWGIRKAPEWSTKKYQVYRKK